MKIFSEPKLLYAESNQSMKLKNSHVTKFNQLHCTTRFSAQSKSRTIYLIGSGLRLSLFKRHLVLPIRSDLSVSNLKAYQGSSKKLPLPHSLRTLPGYEPGAVTKL